MIEKVHEQSLFLSQVLRPNSRTRSSHSEDSWPPRPCVQLGPALDRPRVRVVRSDPVAVSSQDFIVLVPPAVIRHFHGLGRGQSNDLCNIPDPITVDDVCEEVIKLEVLRDLILYIYSFLFGNLNGGQTYLTSHRHEARVPSSFTLSYRLISEIEFHQTHKMQLFFLILSNIVHVHDKYDLVAMCL